MARDTEAVRAYRKAYYQAHREETIARSKEREAKLRAENPEAFRASRRQYVKANKERLTEYHKAYYEANKSTILPQQREYRQACLAGPDSERVRELRRERVSKWAKGEKGMERNRRYQRERGRALRAEMLAEFGHVCACCGETAEAFLTLDHIGGGGKAHRKSVGNAAWAVLNSVKKMGWPKDRFRLLCMNCNFATRYGRTCPHVVRQADEMLAGVLCS